MQVEREQVVHHRRDAGGAQVEEAVAVRLVPDHRLGDGIETRPDGHCARWRAHAAGGLGLAAICAKLLPGVYGSRVVLLVGGGDSGGDALYAGARLAERRTRRAVLAGSKTHEEWAGGAQAVGGSSSREVGTPDLILDRLLGIGGKGALREPSAVTLARIAGQPRAMVVAVDIPSGVDSSTGEVAGEADQGADHGDVRGAEGRAARRPGGRAGGGRRTGRHRAHRLSARAGDHRADRPGCGRVLPVRGSSRTSTAAGSSGSSPGVTGSRGGHALAVGGAVRSGAGMVRFAGPKTPSAGQGRWPEAITTVLDRDPVQEVGRVQAWVLGPGMGTDERAQRIVAEVLGTELPVIVDADALSVVAKNPKLLHRQAPTLMITPHAGELGRLLGIDPQDIEAKRIEHAKGCGGARGDRAAQGVDHARRRAGRSG